MSDLFRRGLAVLSPCEQYRYLLRRRWSDGPTAVFIMLNPSTADATNDDPTIRRCVSFAKREDCGGLLVANLFAYRSTQPDALMLADDPSGPENAEYLHKAVSLGSPVIAAWGAWKGAQASGAVLAEKYPNLMCLGKTKDGAPRHPLYVKGDAPLVQFSEVRANG